MTEKNEVEELRGVLTNVLCNASNYPEQVQSRILGADMSPLLDGVAEAILAAGYTKSPQVEGVVEWGVRSKVLAQFPESRVDPVTIRSEAYARQLIERGGFDLVSRTVHADGAVTPWKPEETA